ncbi:MAG: DUF6285 domain-containing protein [Ilumatobacteraceae bacterium]
MQDRPTAAELLEAVADSLDGEVLPVVDFTVQHKVRVAANICRIVVRELQLGADADCREHDALVQLLGRDGTLAELNAAAAEHLRHAPADELPAAVEVLVDAVAGKLTINKPGYAA